MDAKIDIKAKIEELAKKIMNDKALQEQFKKDPVKAVEKLLGVDLPDDQINMLIEGVKAKIDVDKVAGIAKGLGSLLKK